MTTKPTRAEFIRQHRSSQRSSTKTSQSKSGRTSHPASTAKRVYHPGNIFLPVGSQPARRHQFSAEAARLRLVQTPRSNRTKAPARRSQYDIAFSLGNTGVRAPAIHLPEFGPRWLSGALTLLLIFLLYSLWNASTFSVQAAEVTGNKRLSGTELNAMLGVSGQPVFKVVPAVIEANLRNAYTDLSSVKAQVSLPNHVSVEVVERVPVLAWYQNGVVTWIDSEGVAFLPHGEAQGLIQIAASRTPPKVDGNSDLPVYEQKFIAPTMVKAMVDIFPKLPANVPMIYDPQYGIGFQDPRGWFVYFGQTADNIPAKLSVYQSIVDTLTQQGIQPSLVSLEYLDAPYYK